MRSVCFSIVTFCVLMGGCSEGISTAEAGVDIASPDAISSDVQQAPAASPPSRLAANPTSQLVKFYLHYYDLKEEEQDYDLHDEVKQELIARGAETVSELLKYPYSLNKSPYSYQSSELIKATGPEAIEAIPALAESLAQGTDPTVGNQYEVECLVAIGPASIPELIKHFNSDDLRVAWAVSIPLRQLGVQVVPHLKPSLLSDNEDRRRLALDTLAEIGHEANELIPEVRHIMENDEEYGNRVFAARTLADIGDVEAGLSFLICEVKRWNDRLSAQDDPPSESYWALAAIDRCHVTDHPAVIDVLLETLEHPIANRRAFAIDALATHSHTPHVQAAFRKMLQSKAYEENYFHIADELGRWGSRFPLEEEDFVIALLEKRKAETDEEFKLGISNGLGRILTRRMMDSMRERQIEMPKPIGLN